LLAGCLLLLFLWTGTTGAQNAAESHVVRVGVFPVEPIVTLNPGEPPRGFFVDLLEEIARNEQWSLEYVAGTWNEGLERLEAGSIDLMTAVSPTAERALRMRFGAESVLMVWGQVFTRPDNRVTTILDLQDKTVAVARSDINGQNFRQTADAFGVTCNYREVATHEDIFQLLRSGEADAGVVPNLFGHAHSRKFGLIGTSIIFIPVEAHFAAPLNGDPALLQTIDRYLAQWKQDEGSVYYAGLQNLMNDPSARGAEVPAWILWSGGLALLLVGIMFFLNRVLTAKFQQRTRELRESEAKQRAIFDQSYQFVGLLDPAGIVLDVNQTALDFIGAGKEDVVGSPFWEAPWWSHSEEAQNEIKRGIETAASGEFYRSVAIHPGPDGLPHHVEFTVKSIKDDDGRVKWLVPEGRDITEYRNARENLARLGQAVEQTADMIVITDPVGRMEYVNPAFVRGTGFDPQELAGQSLGILCPQDLTDGLYSRRWFDRLGRDPWRGRVAPVVKGGQSIEVDASVSPILDDDDSVAAYVVVQRDMSQVAELERSLRQSQRLEAVGTLAAGIAHDFNNILAAIFGYTELAQLSVEENSPASEYLDEVLVGAERARALVRQILVFGRRTEQEMRALPLAPLVHEVIELLRSTMPATIKVEEDLEIDGSIRGDSGQIHQVVMNLCTNAFQAMEDLGGVLKVTLNRASKFPAADADAGRPEAATYLAIEVSDNGPGMDDEMLDKIFEPYFTTKDPGKGTGLGLAVVHGIVKSHHGFLEVESKVGKGTVFCVMLPEIAAEDDVAIHEVSQDGLPGLGEHILFVDDEETLGRLVEAYFTDLGYNVSTLTDSREAWDVFRADPADIDLVISDQTMPQMSGFDLASQMLALRPDLPFVLCTGYSADISRESAMALGISRFVQKPVAMERLGVIVRGLLDRRKG